MSRDNEISELKRFPMKVSDNLREPDLPVEKPKAKQTGSKITYVMNELLLSPPDYLYK